MRTEKLNYDLPSELIAQQPVAVRSESRLLVLNRDRGDILDSRFDCVGDFLSPGDCLVLNDTKVLPARFFARRRTGAKLEGLFLSEQPGGIWTVLSSASTPSRPLDEIKGTPITGSVVRAANAPAKCAAIPAAAIITFMPLPAAF